MPRPSRKALAQPKYGFFNLPSDEALGYPRFSSFEQREAYIRKDVPKEVLDRFNQIVAADHENQANGSVEETNEVEDYADMEHSQRFLDDTKRFKALMKAANQRYQDAQDYGSIRQVDKLLPKGSQEQGRETSGNFGPETVSLIDGYVNTTLDNTAMLGKSQVPMVPKSITDPVNHNLPTRSPPTSSKGEEPGIDKLDQRHRGGSSSSISSTLRDRSHSGSSPLKRKNKYLEPRTFQQLPLKSLTRPKKKLRISSPVKGLTDHLTLIETVFVGETTSLFVPLRGDLIVVHPDKGKESIAKGYLASYEGPNTHKFEHGELVVRIGYYEQIEQRKYLHQPYKDLELYAYNREGDWRYLGRQAEMINTSISIDESLGKYLQVGSPVTSSCQFNPIIPRRGDVIIRRAAWIENFPHRENFRRSVVKWYTDRPVQWEPDDMLLRLFVDKKTDCNTELFVYSEPLPSPDPGDHSGCTHGPCREEHTPPAPGFAELYRIEGPESDMGWVFWGRTEHIYDTPYLKRYPLYLRLYACDEEKECDLEFEIHSPKATDN